MQLPSLLQASLLALPLARGCYIEDTQAAATDYSALATANLKARDKRNAPSPDCEPEKIALYNVRVFDGRKVGQPTTIVIDGDKIGHDKDAPGARRIDGNGGVLLPGLIDSHCHPLNATDLIDLTKNGVTTAMSMACFEPQFCLSLQNHRGLVDVKTSTTPASAPGSQHGNMTIGATNSSALLLSSPQQVPAWIQNQTAWGPDYIKLIAESQGLDQQILNDIAGNAHKLKKQSICHAADYASYQQAVTAHVTQVHHTPLDRPIDEAMVKQMLQNEQISAPTLTIAEAFAKKIRPEMFTVANASVGVLHKAKVPILAGTDANNAKGLLAPVPFGTSLHQELQYLVQAGLSPTHALRAATVLPARHFGMHDRGTIEPGKRADLLLVSGDPSKDITATRNIQRIWVAGIEYHL